MTFINLLEWWNLVYIVPFGLAVMYLALFVFTGITFGDGDADMDADVDGDLDGDVSGPVHVEAHVVDADADGDYDADGDSGIEMHAGADHDADHDAAQGAATPAMTHAAGVHGGGHHGSVVGDLLSFLGLGKIPLSLALMTLLLFWGVIGFAMNVMLVQWLGISSLVGLVSLPVTLAISLALTGGCAAVIAKVIPVNDGRGQKREDLVGRCGDAIFDIDSSFGMASVRNAAGDLFQVPCQTADAQVRIPKGSRVVLFQYDREKGVFHVAPFAV